MAGILLEKRRPEIFDKGEHELHTASVQTNVDFRLADVQAHLPDGFRELLQGQLRLMSVNKYDRGNKLCRRYFQRLFIVLDFEAL